jgi:dTDP-4-dehydrorhamnose 3,5-epimerase
MMESTWGTPISGVEIIRRIRFDDGRGHLERIWESSQEFLFLDDNAIHQINHTKTLIAGTIRGMHLQLPPAEEFKIVTCLSGRIYDVVVDLRPNSKSFSSWMAVELSENSASSLKIPPGCAHGFQSLQDDCQLLYLHTANYSQEFETGLSPLNREIGIPWPLPVTNVSTKDSTNVTDLEFFRSVEW